MNTIIIPTHSSYSKTIDNFLKLLNKNWKDCPCKIVVSTTGEDIKIKGVSNIYNGKTASLIDCVVNAANKYKDDYYIVMLGDAMICKKINTDQIKRIEEEIIEAKAEYCSINYEKNYKKRKKYKKYLRYINTGDRYSHSFVAYIASKKYIINTLSNFESDLGFEKYYLQLSNKNRYYDNHLIVNKNYFNILPSINKGKWDYINFKKLTKENPDIDFEDRKISSLKESILLHIRNRIIHLIPQPLRVIVKRKTEKIMDIKFGINE